MSSFTFSTLFARLLILSVLRPTLWESWSKSLYILVKALLWVHQSTLGSHKFHLELLSLLGRPQNNQSLPKDIPGIWMPGSMPVCWKSGSKQGDCLPQWCVGKLVLECQWWHKFFWYGCWVIIMGLDWGIILRVRMSRESAGTCRSKLAMFQLN